MSVRVVAPVLLAVLLAGCGGDRDIVKKPVVPAEGKVLYRGKPPVGAEVLLVPADDPSPDALKPRGKVEKDGTVRLKTYPTADGKPDGAPPGDYLVSVRWTSQRQSADDPDEGGPPGPPSLAGDRLKDKYSNPKTSGLKLTVAAGKPLALIDLK